MTVLRDAVERSAAPAMAGAVVERLVDSRPALAGRLADDDALRAAVVAVAAASRSLGALLLADEHAVEVLAALDRQLPPPAADEGVDGLGRWKRRALLRIAARDLLGLDRLEAVGAALADVADGVARVALELAGDRAADLVVVAMGKWGARELNYASDIDLVFVGAGDARPVMDAARACFRVDANLRPEGRNGPLVRSLASFESYWERWAQPWEFQALLKARPVAGDPGLAGAFAAAASARVWERPFTAEDLRQVRDMKARAEGEVRRRGLQGREVKLGSGGIRDIEFAAQLLQLVHGRHDPALRCPSTLAALGELGRAGYVDPDDAAALDGAYRFLREVEHRLQLVDERQVHTVPDDEAERTHLARVLGYRDAPERDALDAFDADLRRRQAEVRTIHERLYFRPLLEAFARVDGTAAPGPGLSADAAAERLAAFGFADAERTRQALQELTRGLTRSSRLMHQLLPLLLQWLSDAPDPDLGLLGLRTLATGEHRTARLVTAFRESPEVARRLCCLLGTSRTFVQGLEHQPDLIAALGDPAGLRPRSRAEVLDRIRSSLAWRGDSEERVGALRRKKQREVLRIAAADVLDGAGVEAVGGALTGLAEAVLEAALSVVEPRVPLAAIAMGRFGGAELSYASDLDVLLVHGGDDAGDAAAAEESAEALLRLVKGATPASRVWLLDADLRPEGRQGPLARSLDGYVAYWDRWAQPWERQALTRARFAAGDEQVGRRFLEAAEAFVWRPLGDDDARAIRRMKARVERERIPAGEDPEFHLKLGRGSLSDVEWTAQLLQLEHGVRATGTMDALRALRAGEVLSAQEAEVLGEAYRFCERTRNRWFLIKGATADALPTRADELARLAHSLDTTPTQLRERYRKVTRRARAVMESRFYGKR